MTSIALLLGIVVFITTLPLATSTNGSLSLALMCDGNYDTWCANAFVYKLNNYPHDFVAEQEVCVSNKSWTIMNISLDHVKPNSNRDSYELVAMITHNCTSNGNQFCHEEEENTHVANDNTKTIKVSLILDDKVDDDHPCSHPPTQEPKFFFFF